MRRITPGAGTATCRWLLVGHRFNSDSNHNPSNTTEIVNSNTNNNAPSSSSTVQPPLKTHIVTGNNDGGEAIFDSTSDLALTPEAISLRNARREAFLQGQAEYERIQKQKEQERLLRQQQNSQNTGLRSKTNVVTDVKVGKKKGPWGNNQLKDAWSSDAMSRHDKDSIDKRLGSEHRYNPYERDRRILKIMFIWAVPSWLVGLGVVYYFTMGKYPWQADYQHFLNILRQLDQSPRSKFYLYRSDNLVKRGTEHGPATN